jgi:hypothetical protein
MPPERDAQVEVELESDASRRKYHRELQRKTATFRRLQAEQARVAEREDEQPTKYFVQLRERQLAAAASKLAAQGKDTAIRRRCNPIVPPPRKPPPTPVYSTLVRSPRPTTVQRSTPPVSARLQSATSTAQHSRSILDGGRTSDRSRQLAVRHNGVYRPELEPMRMPEFQSLQKHELFPNRMADTQFLAKLSNSEEEKVETLRRAQHPEAEAALWALEQRAEERKLRATRRRMADRLEEIKQATKDAADLLNLQLRAEPGIGTGFGRPPTAAP